MADKSSGDQVATGQRGMPVVPGLGIGGPLTPAGGGSGRWVRLGEVGVDSGTIGITDLLSGGTDTVMGARDSRYAVPGLKFVGDWGTGIRLQSGFGDGGYAVWGWVANFGCEGKVDERIAQVVVTLIDDHAAADWQESVCLLCSNECSECQGAHCDDCDWQGRVPTPQYKDFHRDFWPWWSKRWTD